MRFRFASPCRWMIRRTEGLGDYQVGQALFRILIPESSQCDIKRRLTINVQDCA